MDQRIICPKCDSANVEEIVSDESRSYGGFLYLCNECGQEFDESEGVTLTEPESGQQ